MTIPRNVILGLVILFAASGCEIDSQDAGEFHCRQSCGESIEKRPTYRGYSYKGGECRCLDGAGNG